MKLLTYVIFLLLYFSQANAQSRCGLDGRSDWTLPDKYYSLTSRQNTSTEKLSDYTVEVVFHIVHHENDRVISTEDIQSQLQALNAAFNTGNTDLVDVPFEFRPFIGRGGIQFCLASPSEHPQVVDGVVRTTTEHETVGFLSALYDANEGGSPLVSPSYFLNIYVADLGNRVTGLAATPGAPTETPQSIIIHPNFFGKNRSRRYNLGRVAVHEVGHFFGLSHPWETQENCLTTGSTISDLPVQSTFYEGCPSYPQNSCASSDLFMNFMDYVDDECMVMFTAGQVSRMRYVLEELRPDLLSTNTFCPDQAPTATFTFFTVYPNPVKTKLFVRLLSVANQDRWATLYDNIGRQIRQQSITPEQTDLTFNTHNLPPGIYYLRIGTEVSKILKAS